MRAFLLVETPHPWGMGRDNGDRWGSTETARWWLLCCTEVESKWSATGLYLLEPSLYALGLYRVERGHIEGWWCSGYQGLWWIKMGRFETTEMNPCSISRWIARHFEQCLWGSSQHLVTRYSEQYGGNRFLRFWLLSLSGTRTDKRFMTALCQGYLLLNKDKRLSIGLQHFLCGKNNSSLGVVLIELWKLSKVTNPNSWVEGFNEVSCSPWTLGKWFNLTCAYFSNGLVKNHRSRKRILR